MDKTLETFVPLAFRRRGAQRVISDGSPVHDAPLINGLAKGFFWQHLIDIGKMKSGAEIARAEGVHFTVVTDVLRLTILAPDIIERVMNGKQPRRMNLAWFQHNRIPVNCEAQRHIVKQFEENV